MADGVRVEIGGLRELEAALKRLGGPVARSAMRAAARAGATVIRDEARALVPVRTGLVRENIVVRVRRDERTSTGSAVRFSILVRTRKGMLNRVKKGVRLHSMAIDPTLKRETLKVVSPYYWRYVEFGTRKMNKQPFLRPALENKAGAAVERMKAVLWRRIKRAGGPGGPLA